MLRARVLLYRQLQEFFDKNLVGLISWNNVAHRTAELDEKSPGVRQREKEVVVIDFAQYALEIRSTSETPPLGKVTLFDRGNGEVITGTISAPTWERIAGHIHAHPPVKEHHHVYG